MLSTLEHASRHQRIHRLVDLRGKAPDGELAQFFLEERFRRSFSLTGYLLSGGGAVGSLYANKAPSVVLRLLLIASGLFLAAVVVGFVAALAAFKAFEAAAFLPVEKFSRLYNWADRWMATTVAARVAAAVLIASGGLAASTAYIHLAWR